MPNYLDSAKAVAAIASVHAQEVDELGRFPSEAIVELRQTGLLGLAVSFKTERSRILPEILEVCTLLSQACPSTAMVFAMHTLCVIQLSVHGGEWHADFLRRLETHPLLIASATSEVGLGGATSDSLCTLTYSGEAFGIEKNCSVISYGEQADAILLTARTSADVETHQQALVLCLKENYSLTLRTRWNAMGMRGTCSHAFNIFAGGSNQQIFADNFGMILQLTGLPTAHLLWGHVWLGLAIRAHRTAKRFLRKRRVALSVNSDPLTSLYNCLSNLRSIENNLKTALQDYQTFSARGSIVHLRELTLNMNILKTRTSTEAMSVVQQAMDICGLTGYLNEGDYTLAQTLRDVLSSKYMVSNSRIASNMHPFILV